MPYSTIAELETYAEERGITIPDSPGVLLVRSNDYIESLSYKGSRISDTQIESWPRKGVVVDGILIDETTVPNDIKKAEIQIALDIDAGFDPLAIRDREARKEELEGLKVEYSASSSNDVRTQLSAANAILNKYLDSSIGSNAFFNVVKG